ncbi:MAG: B12-binding domain-containing radical SAM protein [Deltaproteobacteria bacterium]|nr:B12-binding domain-containing radical SAM protein [Deltaproteobacteria bacterium]
MRILFIYPSINAQVGFNYGVAFLAGMLKSRGHETALITINEKLGYPLDRRRVEKDIESFAPHLIGISMVTNQYKYCLEIASHIKKEYSLPIIGGGIHATADPEGVMESGLFDFVCLGEGEHALAELVERLETGKDCAHIPNLWVRKNGTVIKNPVAPFVDLSTLPPKDYEVFGFQQMIDAKQGWVGVMASRGCPYRCSYCFNHQMVNLYKKDLRHEKGRLHYLRRHPVDEVIRELRYLLGTYENITTFIFDDDIFTLDKAYLVEFCRRYRKEIMVPYVVNAHIRNFDPGKARVLKESGCKVVKFGLESGSERIREKILNRRMSNDDIIRGFEIAHQAGLHTSAFVMFGFPHETREDILMTTELLGVIKPGRFRWSIFFPYINTDAYHIAREGNFLNDRKMASLDNFFEESCLDFGPEMNLWMEKLQKVFPWYVNKYAQIAVSKQYARLVEEVEALSAEQWSDVKDDFPRRDQEVSQYCIGAGELHYAIKFNPFMGVRSDYFLDEEAEKTRDG